MYKLTRHNSPINQNRDDWYKLRKNIEKTLYKKTEKKRTIIQKASRIFPMSLFDSIGRKNILKIQHNQVIFEFSHLPKSFDGFSILHVSDPHFGGDPLLNEAICESIRKIKSDLTIFTGDYQFGYGDIDDSIIYYVNYLAEASQSPLPVLAILGNHDCAEMVRRIENDKLFFLNNELVSIKNNEEEIFIYGIDEALIQKTFNKPENSFGICLGHNVEYAEDIAKNGWNLMLAGHSHGGQICLPFGFPIFLSIDFNRHIAIGKWKEFNMQGYTSKGCGVSTLPWRLNCPPQTTNILLKKT